MHAFSQALRKTWNWCNDPRHALRARIAQIAGEQTKLSNGDAERQRQLNEARHRLVMALKSPRFQARGASRDGENAEVPAAPRAHAGGARGAAPRRPHRAASG